MHRCLKGETNGCIYCRYHMIACWSNDEKFGDKLYKGRGNLSQCDNSAHFVYNNNKNKINK